MAAFAIVGIVGPRVAPFVAGVPASRVARRAESFLATGYVTVRRRIDLSAAATTVLVAGRKVLVAVWLVAAVAVGLYGMVASAP